MPNVTPARVMIHPSYVLPEFLLQYQQASGAFETIATGNPMVRLGEGDLFVYAKKMELRTKVASGQTAYNQLPSVETITSMIQTPTYLQRIRAEYDHHDTAAAAKWGYSIVDAQRLGMRQGHFGNVRNALLYGFNPANGEGLLNTNGATAVLLPPDMNGNTTVRTYDNGAMALFLIGQVSALKTRMFQMGQGVKITICGSQQTLAQFAYAGIVQLVQFQRPGAGTDSTAGMTEKVLEMNGDTLEWVYDDTLIGKGSGGSDAVIITMPEVRKPKVQNQKINTNEFAELTPGLEAANIQLCDMAAPREIPTPIPGGAIDVVSEMRITSGWGLRPEAITIVSMPY
jgi:hypothetical protein